MISRDDFYEIVRGLSNENKGVVLDVFIETHLDTEEYIFFEGTDKVCLDGSYTMLDLSAILTAMRRMQEVHHD